MQRWLIPRQDITSVDRLLIGPDNLLQPVPYAQLQDIPIELLQLWCVRRGVYQIVTTELLDWLAAQIQGKRALEICAGNGIIGRQLGITCTDSYIQTRPEVVAYYRSIEQEPITPPDDVLKYDANMAVAIFQPTIIIGSWVTQLWQPGDSRGSMFGVDELAIINQVSYIHIGNDTPHGDKRVMQHKHQCYRFPWLVSRAYHQQDNHICVWTHKPS